jgi:PhnB protein
MAKVGIYLNFTGDTEAAFELYRSAFGGEFANLQRMREVPGDPAHPISEKEQELIAHIELQILGGTSLMGTDMIESMGQTLRIGNNITISLELDVLDDANRIFTVLSDGGSDIQPLSKMFWGAHWGTCADRYGVRWMFNVPDAPG